MAQEFKMQLDLGNDEFADEIGRRLGVVRLLREVATKAENGRSEGALFDINGNRVGSWGFDECEDEG